MTIRIRDAAAADHAEYCRLFPELRIDDPLPDQAKFDAEIRPTSFVAELEHRVVGFLYYVVLADIGYVKVIISDPAMRRRGIGRAMMQEAIDRFRAAGAKTCVLNVFPHNEAAIALYESFGLERDRVNQVLVVKWDLVASRPAEAAGIRARAITPEDDARVEPAMKLMKGQLADTRKRDRVMMMLEHDDGAVEGAALFDPSFPGAYPFRMAKPEHAFVLLHALRPHALPQHAIVHVVVEGDRPLADMFLAAGATLKMETLHMRGPIS
jgi:GNAT superfamily N-acetyltransferase